jgi:hypothetical protein
VKHAVNYMPFGRELGEFLAHSIEGIKAYELIAATLALQIRLHGPIAC